MRNLSISTFWDRTGKVQALRQRAFLWRAVITLLLLCAIVPASAHFLLNLNVRIFHIDQRSDGLHMYVRMPMPYLVADRVGAIGADGLPDPAAYTYNRMEDGNIVHYVDFDQLRQSPAGLGTFAAEGIQLVAMDRTLEAVVEDVHVYSLGMQPNFATLDEAKQAFAAEQYYPVDEYEVYVGDAVVDIVLSYQTGAPIYAYTLSSSLDPGLPGQEDTANLVLDYSPGGIQVFRARGLLADPVSISRSVLSAVTTFIKEGIRHILEGLDHVLFVLCLTLGAFGIRSLLWRVTGFTIGHSVTLSAGFFGFVPSGEWFVPAVEMGIALSIIYAAAIAVVPKFRSNKNELRVFVVTSLIGLLHGLGFSFVLLNILQVTSPNIWQSLLAFNIGVELGQILIIVFASLLFWSIGRFDGQASSVGRWIVAGSSIVIASFWTVQRGVSLVGF